MGKPFDLELRQIAETLTWAFTTGGAEHDRLQLDPQTPAYCIGSGGSQSAADFLARIIREAGGFAWATTPMEYLTVTKPGRNTAVFLLSAGGRNKDILAVAEKAILNESALVFALTARAQTPLCERLIRYGRGITKELPVPAGKDGFLATNSLVAMIARLLPLTGQLISQQEQKLLLETAQNLPSFAVSQIDFHARPEVIILYAGWAGPAAFDLESKLSEAALAPAMLCDVRSFGHGRHHWVAKHPEKTVIVALSDEVHGALLDKTVAFLPQNIPIITLRTTCSGPIASLDLVLKTFGLVNWIGKEVGIDPGRPGVPEFGRKLYHLAPQGRASKEPMNTVLASLRKSDELPSHSHSVDDIMANHAKKFKERLADLRLTAIVTDYDGTLVDTKDRFSPIRDDLAKELNRLLESGLTLGIATGRGKSVREPLRQAIRSEYWSKVLVGYYNGSQIIALDQNALPDATEPEGGILVDFRNFLTKDQWISLHATTELRLNQVTITSEGCSRRALWEHVSRLLTDFGSELLQCFTSSHSVDVLTRSTSKLDLVKRISTEGSISDSILCIGDSGLWPGNDCDLLRHFPSLSSGSQPVTNTTGWNLAPRGLCEAEATLYYLRHLQLKDGVRAIL